MNTFLYYAFGGERRTHYFCEETTFDEAVSRAKRLAAAEGLRFWKMYKGNESESAFNLWVVYDMEKEE